MRTALIASISLCWIASAAVAQTGPASPSAEKRPEGPKGKGDVADPLASCLAMWEPATHMTRQQWARACRRVADRLRDTVIK